MVSRSVQDSTSFSSLESDIDENEDIPSDASDPSVDASDWEDEQEEDEENEEEEEDSHEDSRFLKKDKTKKDGSPWRLQLDSSLSMQAHKLKQKEQSKASFLLTSQNQTRAAEKKKAANVKVQKRLSNDLLALRIRLNEALRQTNRLPNIDLFRLLEACDTKSSDIHPNSSVLSLREKSKKSSSHDGNLAHRENSDEVPSSLPELLATVRQEAAELFMDLRSLQGSVFSRGSLPIADEEEEDEEEEEFDTCEEDDSKQEDSWECRRRRWRRMQMELARDGEDAKVGEGGEEEEDRERRISRKKRKTEMGVWSDVVDALWYRKAKRLCLEKIDAWHATVDPRSQSFKALSQPPSLQLQHAMTTQYSRLLPRSLHSAHLPPPSSSSPSSSSTSPKDSLSARQKQEQTQVHSHCHIVGCDLLQWMWRTRREEIEEEERDEEEKKEDPPRHYYYDDGDFYLELLKQVVKQGGALDSGDALEKEKSLLKIRNKLNRTRTDVDRRASKGRKIRYQPIEKLQNLVAAIPWQPNLDVLPGAGDPTIVDKLMSQLFANE